MPDGKGLTKKPDRKTNQKSTAFPTVGRVDGLRAPILATRISPRAGSAPLPRWQGGSREHGDRVWFSETGHFERRPIPVRTTINPRHQLPHDQSRCITCTLYCHVGQARYLPQTTNFMCHDEDVATYCLVMRLLSISPTFVLFDHVSASLSNQYDVLLSGGAPLSLFPNKYNVLLSGGGTPFNISKPISCALFWGATPFTISKPI